jgi:hypothetical protein
MMKDMPMALRRSLEAAVMVVFIAAASPDETSGAQIAPARPAQSTATVTEQAPVFLKPNPRLTPLRTLSVGTVVEVGRIEGDWLQVTFNDRQFGRRTGWVERRFVRINTAPAAPTEPATRAVPPATGAPRPAPAQPRPRPAAPAAARPIGFRVFASAASDRMEAERSFEAATGSDRAPAYGGGAQVTNLWRGVFFEVAGERTTRDGQRVFVSGDQTFGLGIPLKIEITPVDVVGGWRHPVGAGFAVYGGVGGTFVSYKETSDFAEEGENVDERGRGVVLLGGVEARVWRWIHVRGELRYRRVRDVIGGEGISAEFGEDTLGGFGGGIKIAVGR